MTTTLMTTVDGVPPVIAREGTSVAAVVAMEAVEEAEEEEAGAEVEEEVGEEAVGLIGEEETFSKTTGVGTAIREEAMPIRTTTHRHHRVP